MTAIRAKVSRFVGESGLALRLGLQLVHGAGVTGLFRIGALATATMVGCLLVMAALAVPPVVDAQQDRAVSRTVVHEGEGLTPLVANREPALRMREIRDGWGGRAVTRIAVAGVTPTAALPPGVSRLPEPGQVVVSPALAELIAADAAVKARYSYPVVGVIAPPGLTAPDELYLYVGVEDRLLRDTPVAGYGNADAIGNSGWAGTSVVERLLKPERLLGYAFGLFLLAPLAVLIGVCARLAARVREQKFAALRLLGATRAQVQIANAVEIGTTTMLSAALGYVLFALITPHTTGWMIGNHQWFAEDVDVSPVRGLMVVLCFTSFALVVAATGSLPTMRKPLQARISDLGGRPSRWRMAPVAVAGLLLAYVIIDGTPSSTTVGAVGAGVLLLALGIPVALPLATHLVASGATKWSNAPVWIHLAADRLKNTPAVAPRLVAGIVTTFYVAGIGLLAAGLAASLRTPEHVLADQPVRIMPDVAELSDPDLAGLRGPGVALARYGVTPAESQDSFGLVVHAGCADLAVLFERVDGPCTEGTAYRVVNTHPDIGVNDANKAGAVWTGGDGSTVRAPTATLQVRTNHALSDAVIVITRRDPGTQNALMLVVQPEAYQAFTERVVRLVPAHQIVYPIGVITGFGPSTLLTTIAVGAGLALAIGFVAFAVASVDHQLSARRRNAPLVVLGVPSRILRLVESSNILVSLAIGVAAAIGALAATAWTVGRLAGSVTTAGLPSMDVFGRSAALALAACLMLLVAITAAASRTSTRLRADLIRHE